MSRLQVYSEGSPPFLRVDTSDAERIAALLGAAGILFERWTAGAELAADAGEAAILAAYRRDVDRLMTEHGYRSVDVVRMLPDHPQKDALRAKYLDEHTHAEDEVRFFVEGAGAFYLHVRAEVFVVRCERGDLLRVPAGTPHWFDMGSEPRFTAIRLFGNPDGWIARYTGDDIARRYPKYESAAR